MTAVTHQRGDEDCSQRCSADPAIAHRDDPPADCPDCCPECGGNGRACWPACTDRTRRYESWEGQTGAEQLIYEDGW